MFWLATENRWRSSRYGLQWLCLREAGAQPLLLEEDVERTLHRVRPIARALGEENFLSDLEPVNQESASDRQRRIFRQTGDWKAVVGDMKSCWVKELHDGATSADSPPPLIRLSADEGRPSVPVAMGGAQ